MSQRHQHRQRGADLAEVAETARNAGGGRITAREPAGLVAPDDRWRARPALFPAAKGGAIFPCPAP